MAAVRTSRHHHLRTTLFIAIMSMQQVLIFSQFKIMLDVLEDYLTACKYPCERIDGDTNHKDRQAAIDRFMAGKDKRGASSSRGTTPAPGDVDGKTTADRRSPGVCRRARYCLGWCQRLW